MSSKGRQRLIGFGSLFTPLITLLAIGVKIFLKAPVRSGYNGDEEHAVISLVIIIVAVSLLPPILLWGNGLKEYAKGALWGVLVFYLIVFYLILTLIDR
ncbi:hypothetical protein [Taibaiella koreensis]|uniref:hypothetical protein n=1 Tax=Taibaiella koreensis TaxID=1268548 RepID=UPI000E599C52|nr:hypothetical protein [Taibaiella koreensis]